MSFIFKFKYLTAVLALPAILTLAGTGCSNTKGQALANELAKANENLSQAAQVITDFTTTSPDAPLPPDLPQKAADSEIALARSIAAIKRLPPARKVIELKKELENAAPLVSQINAAIANPAPSQAILDAARDVANAVRDMLKAAAASNHEIIGEQILADVDAQLPEPPQAEQEIIGSKMTQEANEAANNGENVRDLIIRLAEVIHLQRRNDAIPNSTQTLPAETPSAEVPSALTQVGAFGSLAQLTHDRLSEVDPADDALPPECRLYAIGEDTCDVVATPTSSPADPLKIITTDVIAEIGEEVADIAAELGEEAVAVLPTDLFDATNVVIQKANDTHRAFLDGDLADPLLNDDSISTLEVELAQITVWLNHFPQTAEVALFKEQVEGAFILIEHIAAQLDVPPSVTPETDPKPDLAGVNTAFIPTTAPPALSASPFRDTRTAPLTLKDALFEGGLKASRAIARIVGENAQTLHDAAKASPPSFPSASEIAETTGNYENAAVRADNDGNHVKAATLRQIKKDFSYRTGAQLPLPVSSARDPNPLSQEGIALYHAILLEERAKAMSPLDFSPAGCKRRGWDENDCANITDGNLLPIGH